jgi:hypothetical protein
MMKRTVQTEKEFKELMGEVDAALQGKGVPIHLRVILAIREVSQRLNVDLIYSPLRTGPIPGLYEGESLSAHIQQWTQKRYGERLKVDFANGYSLLLIRGDPWLLRFPVIFGKITVVCDRDLSKQYPNLVVTQPGQPRQKGILNLFKCIENLPQELASDLADSELREILNYFLFGHEFLNKLNSFCRGNELVMTALSDLNASAKLATGNPSEYGQSRWASLQAAEKLLKFYIEKKRSSFPHIHELSRLEAKASKLGLPKIADSVLKAVQCSAGIRYSQQQQSVESVVGAHKGAMNIGSIVINALYPK